MASYLFLHRISLSDEYTSSLATLSGPLVRFFFVFGATTIAALLTVFRVRHAKTNHQNRGRDGSD